MGDIDNDVFADGPGDGSFYLLTGRMVGEGLVRGRCVLVGDHAALLGNGFESVRIACNRDFGIRSAVVPAEFFNEKRLEIVVL